MSKTGKLVVYLGYSETPCPECGRLRVEVWSNGRQECEICHWSPVEWRYIMPWEEADDGQ